MAGIRQVGMVLLVGTAVGCPGRTSLPEPAVQTAIRAEAELINRQRQRVGTALLEETPTGVRISVQLFGIPRGRHGMHIHQNGRCDLPRFATAGEHFSVPDQQHGMESPRGPHSGDLPNVVIGVDGFGTLNAVNSYVTLRAGTNSLLRPGGTALVIHADPDDYRTDPTGSAGERIACGVIRSR